MDKIPTLFAKLAGIYKAVEPEIKNLKVRYVGGVAYNPAGPEFFEYFERFADIREDLKAQLPELYSDLTPRDLPKQYPNGNIDGTQLVQLVRDIDYIFEVRTNSKIGESVRAQKPQRVFISHGRSQDWREVQAYIEKDLSLNTLELAQEPNRGRTVLQKLDEESNKCSYAVVVMTGDDNVGGGAPRARENVIHEIGFFQAKFGLENVCLLYEEGTSIPSNIHGVVYIPYPKGLVSASFGILARELRAAFSSTP